MAVVGKDKLILDLLLASMCFITLWLSRDGFQFVLESDDHGEQIKVSFRMSLHGPAVFFTFMIFYIRRYLLTEMNTPMI
jgi:hypothetical protein